MSIRKRLEEFDRKEKEKAWKLITNGEMHTDEAYTLLRIEIVSKKIDLLAEELENLIRGGKK